MIPDYDTIVVGGGHNGLVCAAYLARAGQRVLLLEAREDFGGLAATHEFHPGFRASVAHSFHGLSQKMVAELCLAEHGFALPDEAEPTVALVRDSEPVVIHDETVTGVSAADGEAYRAYRRQLKIFAKALAPFWSRTMPRLGGNDLRELLTFGELGLRLRLLGRDDMLEFLRVASLPMRDLVDVLAALSHWFNRPPEARPRRGLGG